MVENKEPEAAGENGWKGHIINIAIYKGGSDDRPLVSKKCRVGNYIILQPTHKLYFATIIPDKRGPLHELLLCFLFIYFIYFSLFIKMANYMLHCILYLFK